MYVLTLKDNPKSKHLYVCYVNIVVIMILFNKQFNSTNA